MSEEKLTKKERLAQKREEKAAKKAAAEAAAKKKKMTIVAAFAAAAVVLIMYAIFGTTSAEDIIDKSPDPSKGGGEDAEVVVKEYSDFQCPACKAAYPVVKDIVEEYGDQIRFEYNDFPLPQHQYASVAAVGGECAFEQDMFFEYHDMVFDKQDVWGQASTRNKAIDYLAEYAEEVGLDMDAFDTCVNSQAAADRVNEDRAEARELNVNQTPTFFVNGERVVGAPFSISLREAINEALGVEEELIDPTAEPTTEIQTFGSPEELQEALEEATGDEATEESATE